MHRRKFIIATGLTAISISTFGSIIKSGKDSFIGDCETTNDILGPFYRADAPFRTDLTYAGLEGKPINLKGTVFGDDCVSPLSNTLVEVWQCDPNGDYDNQSSNFHLRGKVHTDEQGQYAFKTVLPGKYLNGGQYRPAHIHFRVSTPSSMELISQIYFQGDPHIPNDPGLLKKRRSVGYCLFLRMRAV
jgi:protocatechuate 3,4-dioxygenase beta subunit